MNDALIVQLNPQHILADDNARFGLKQTRIDALAESIVTAGRVLVPVLVAKLEKAEGGKTHRLIAGHYRHAAVEKLNKEGADLTLPAIVRPAGSDLDRLHEQLTENRERENMSPMDDAVAIKKLLDQGVARKDIRKLFARPTGRKGLQLKAASNAWVNICLRFLDLPKGLQERIHDGRIGFNAGYTLTRITPDKREAVVAKIEADRLAQLDREDAEEAKYLEAEKVLLTAQETREGAGKKVEEALAAVKSTEGMLFGKDEELRKMKAVNYLDLDAAGKKAVDEKVRGLKADIKGVEKAVKAAQNTLADLLAEANRAEDAIVKQSDVLAAQTKAKAAPRPIGKKDVEKTAAKVKGATTPEAAKASKYEPRKRSEIIELVDAIAGDSHARVALIGGLLNLACAGRISVRKTLADLAVITGEEKPKAK